jgi:hypothetical protein
MIASSTNVKRYWLNLDSYLQATSIKRVHKDLFEIGQLRDLIRNLLQNSATTLPDYISLAQPNSIAVQKNLTFFLHSPLTLQLTDSSGHVTGLAPDGTVTQDIPGSNYGEFGEVKFVTVPEGSAYHLTMHGQASGTFSLDTQETAGDTITASSTVANLPTTASTTVTMDIPFNTPSPSLMQVDENGDGTTDFSIEPKLNSIVTPDITPPTTTLVTTGTKGLSGWYTSSVGLTFNATDTESGVANTFFSIDGVATSTGVSASLVVEGIHTIRYYSVDKSGNQEVTNTALIKIDKTAPEANLVVSTGVKDLLVTGIDSLSTTTVAKTSTTTTITDQAGNTTKLVFQKTFSGALLTLAQLVSVQYGSSAPVKLPSSFVYLWNPLVSPPTLLSQTAVVDSTYVVQATYNKTKNQTTIVVLKKSSPIQTTVLSGAVLVQLTTNKGALGYSW